MTHVETSNNDTSKKIFTKKIKRREEKKEFSEYSYGKQFLLNL